jgi:biopolymer transport protein ExbD
MPPSEGTTGVRSGINVTPLVDVVLVLLIIFMIIAPQLQTDASVKLPSTDRPDDKPDDGRQIVVVVDENGTVWVDDNPVEPVDFRQRMSEVAEGDRDRKVVIKADARLTFGDVRRAMFAVEAAGFRDVGLIAERRED